MMSDGLWRTIQKKAVAPSPPLQPRLSCRLDLPFTPFTVLDYVIESWFQVKSIFLFIALQRLYAVFMIQMYVIQD